MVEEPDRAEIEASILAKLREFEEGLARVAEHATEEPFRARPPLTERENGVALALNLALDTICCRAQQTSAERSPEWEGWAGAEILIVNELSRWGLPPMAPSYLAFQAELERRDRGQ